MDATTIKVPRDAKAAFDRLQAQLTLARGRRIDHQRLFRALLDLAHAHRSELFAGDAPPRLTPAQRRRILNLGTDWGVSAIDIDREVYRED